MGVNASLHAQASDDATPISYAQILQQPDNLQLVFTYAQQQTEQGNLQVAAGALERLLLLEPEWDDARLYYAIILYRLDDMDGALREFEILETRDLSPAQMREVRRYTGLADHNVADTRISAIISAGLRYDTNRNLASDRDLGFGGPVGPIPLVIPKRDDGAVIGDVRLRIEQDLGSPDGHYVFAYGRGYLNKQFKVTIQDFLIGEVRAGGTFFFDRLQITPYGKVEGLRIDDHHRLTEGGGGLALAYGVSPTWSFRGGFEIVSQNYTTTSNTPLSDLRDGELYSPWAGFSYRIDRNNTFSADVTYHIKDARTNYYSFNELDARIANFTLLGQGQYLLSELRLWDFRADAPDPAYSSSVTRKDFRIKGRLAYGVPISTLARWMGGDAPEAIDDMNVQVSGAYFHQNSNIPNFDLSNFTADIVFTKRLKF
ncbi:MAG: hypothetical protein ACR2OJ_10105 [Hyphomicrobiales bacterium]